MSKSFSLDILLLISLLILSYFPLFLHLDKLPIVLWDESRLALSALEMSENNDYLITSFQNLPDMWSTKPPLMIWIQVMMLKIFGTNELAIRLPSAIAGLLTVLSIYFFLKKYIKQTSIGLISAAVLLTSQGYIAIHVTRTGDYDALLTLFTTTFAFSFFAACEEKSYKKLLLFFIISALAIFTKSISGLMTFPGLLVYAMLSKKLVWLFKPKHILSGIAILGIPLIYYFVREQYNTGYILAIWDNELGGRFSKSLTLDTEPALFYYNLLKDIQFSYWFWFLLPGLAAIALTKDQKLKSIGALSVLFVIGYWSIISIAETKLMWYNAPLFPFLSIVVGIGIHYFVTLITSKFELKPSHKIVLSIIIVAVVFLKPYRQIIGKVYKPKFDTWETEFYQLAYYLKETLNSGGKLPSSLICFEGYHANVLFYTHQLSKKLGPIKIENTYFVNHNITRDITIICAQQEVKQVIESQFEYEKSKLYQNVDLYKVKLKAEKKD